MFIAIFTVAGSRVVESGVFETEAQAQAFLDQIIAAGTPLHSPLVMPAWETALRDGVPELVTKHGAKG